MKSRALLRHMQQKLDPFGKGMALPGMKGLPTPPGKGGMPTNPAAAAAAAAAAAGMKGGAAPPMPPQAGFPPQRPSNPALGVPPGAFPPGMPGALPGQQIGAAPRRSSSHSGAGALPGMPAGYPGQPPLPPAAPRANGVVAPPAPAAPAGTVPTFDPASGQYLYKPAPPTASPKPATYGRKIV